MIHVGDVVHASTTKNRVKRGGPDAIGPAMGYAQGFYQGHPPVQVPHGTLGICLTKNGGRLFILWSGYGLLHVGEDFCRGVHRYDR